MTTGIDVLKNMYWKFGERITAQVVTFFVSIILARILSPSDYGNVAVVTVFITIANVFVSNGLGSALIQKKNADALDFSSSFYFNIFFSLILYLGLYCIAPLIADFFGKSFNNLTSIIRVLGIRIVFSGINSVQQAYVAKHMMFKKFFWSTFIGTGTSAIVGIWLAYNDYGVWAIVGQYLSNTVVSTIALAVVLKIKLIKRFSFERIKTLFNFGIKILASGLLVTVYTELRSFIIGKIYTSADLAFYEKARQFPSLFVNNIVATINAVLFPKMAEEQDNIKDLKVFVKKSLRMTAYVMFPLMFGLIAISKPLVVLVLTDKWLPCVPLLQVLCIAYLWQPIHAANLQAIKALGRSDIILKLEVVKKAIEIFILLCVMNISVNAIVISLSFNATVFMALNAFPNKYLLYYSLTEQLHDIKAPFIMATIMAACIYIVEIVFARNNLIILCTQLFVGFASYLCLSIITKNTEFLYLYGLIKSYLIRKCY